MANTKSAKKRALQNEKRRKHNISLKSKYRTHIKKVKIALASNKNEEVAVALKEAVSVLDKVAAKGIIHKNKAARYKSHLSSKIKKPK